MTDEIYKVGYGQDVTVRARGCVVTIRVLKEPNAGMRAMQTAIEERDRLDAERATKRQ